MNWAILSGTSSSVVIVWPRIGFSMAIFRSVLSSTFPGSSGNISMKKWPFPFVV